MRTIHKEWKDKRSNYSYRIRWYQKADGTDIRLQIETPDGLRNEWPASQESAQATWDKFKADHSSSGCK